MPKEIERKFIVATLPPADELGRGVHIRQGYLAEEGDVEARVRLTDEGCTIAVKAGGGLSRTEVEREISLADAEALWEHTVGRRIDKTRYRIRIDDHVAEVDIYAGALQGFQSVEVEFASETDAAQFAPPAWFGREVTEDRAWNNATLARRGLPPDWTSETVDAGS